MKPAALSVVFYGLKQVKHALKDMVLAFYIGDCNFALFIRERPQGCIFVLMLYHIFVE